MKSKITISLLLISCLCNSQLSLIDSMKIELHHPEISIIRRAEILNEIAWEYAFNDAPEIGIQYSDTLIKLGKLNEIPKIEGLGFIRMGNCFQKLQKDSLALVNFQIGIGIFIAANLTKQLAMAYQNLSIFYYNKSQYAEAVQILELAIALAEKENNTVLKGACYNSMGVNQMRLTEYGRASQSYLHAIKAYEELKDTLQMTVALANLAIVHNKLQENNKALELYQKTEQLFRKLGDKERLADNYGNMGNVLADLGRKEEALHYYDLSIILADSIKYENSGASQRLNKADLLIKEKRIADAYHLIGPAMDYFEKIGNNNTLAEAHITLGDLYANLTEIDANELKLPYQNRGDSVIYHFTKAIDYSLVSGAINLTAEAYEKRSKALEANGQFQNALKDYQNFVVYRDSSFNQKKHLEVARNNMQYEYDKRELLLQTNAEKQRVIKNAAIVVGSALLLISLIGLAFYKRKRDLERRSLESEFQFAISDTEMKALRSQMNPHFIFNALNSIADFIRINESKVADDYLAKFARLMRLVLENSEKQEVTIEKDMEALQLYLTLEQLRLQNKFTFNISINEQIDTTNTLIPPLILQPFVENSIWHGISGKNGNGHIDIHIHQNNDNIICSVEDNGVGRGNQKEKILEKKSMGMKITSERLRILNRIKNTNAKMHILDLKQGTRVELCLPLSLNF